jgi:hypothetical protein
MVNYIGTYIRIQVCKRSWIRLKKVRICKTIIFGGAVVNDTRWSNLELLSPCTGMSNNPISLATIEVSPYYNAPVLFLCGPWRFKRIIRHMSQYRRPHRYLYYYQTWGGEKEGERVRGIVSGQNKLVQR